MPLISETRNNFGYLHTGIRRVTFKSLFYATRISRAAHATPQHNPRRARPHVYKHPSRTAKRDVELPLPRQAQRGLPKSRHREPAVHADDTHARPVPLRVLQRAQARARRGPDGDAGREGAAREQHARRDQPQPDPHAARGARQRDALHPAAQAAQRVCVPRLDRGQEDVCLRRRHVCAALHVGHVHAGHRDGHHAQAAAAAHDGRQPPDAQLHPGQLSAVCVGPHVPVCKRRKQRKLPQVQAGLEKLLFLAVHGPPGAQQFHGQKPRGAAG